MMGLERNADVVRMASYAPLFSNTEAWQWTPDLIWVNSLHVSLTPNYFVQQLFSCNRGDEILPTELSSEPVQKLFASAVHDDQTGEVILKVVNGGEQAAAVEIKLAGAKASAEAKATVLTGAALHEENKIGQPNTIKPVESTVTISGDNFTRTFEPRSVTVLRVKTQ